MKKQTKMIYKNIKKHTKYIPSYMLGLFVFFIILSTIVSAAPDSELTYHGKLTDATLGTAVANGDYNFKLSIYTTSTGGTPVWTSRGTTGAPTSKLVTVSRGIFTTTLGEAGDNSLDSITFNDNYYLGVTIGTNSEMSPRRKITPTGFALNSHRLNGLTADNYINTSAAAQTKLGSLTVATLNTGQGDHELYAMDQDVLTTSSPTFNGLTVNGVGSFQDISIVDAAGTTRQLNFSDTSNGLRWALVTSATAESGSNVGSDFSILAHDDAGSLLGTALTIERATQNIGLGVGIPNEKLQINGAINIGNTTNTNAGTIRWNGSDLQGYDGSSWDSLTAAGVWTQSGGDIYRPGGNVGIGTTTLSQELDVVGDIELNDTLYFKNGTTQYLTNDGSDFILSNDLLPSANTYNLGSSASRWNDLYIGPSTLHIGSTANDSLIKYDTGSSLLTFQNTTDSTTGFQFLDTDGGTPILNVDTTNEGIGIGMTSPHLSKLNVAGAVRVGEVTNDDGGVAGYGDFLYFSGGDDWTGNSDNTDTLSIARYNVAADHTELRMNIGDNNDGNDKFIVGSSPSGTWTPGFTVQNNGFVGIGTTTPGDLLDINTTSTSSGIELDNRDALTGYSGDSYLRLNQSSQWTSGVYTPGNFRADGRVYVDNGTNYLSYPTGNYGSIQINGGGVGSY
ncbi:MAG: hypothetical protein U9Q12_01105, partial [Patescibacteria group bacterium]|nr:hypothetical protein [Patescibacteria group bacterium]